MGKKKYLLAIRQHGKNDIYTFDTPESRRAFLERKAREKGRIDWAFSEF